jgi:hypothetical protein
LSNTPFQNQKGVLSLVSGSGSNEEKTTDQKKDPPFPVRGKAREYSQEFEVCWRRYPRKEQKFEAYAVWNLRVKELGGPQNLVTLIFRALDWQLPIWALKDFEFVPYFERYLKRRKWEDEPPHHAAQSREGKRADADAEHRAFREAMAEQAEAMGKTR